MSSETQTIAFFGSTGGCVNACLVHALRNGYRCLCLVRTPSKLQNQLKEQGIEEVAINNFVIFTEGNALDVAAVKKTLLSAGPNTLPSQIVTGLGGSPKLKMPRFCAPLEIATVDQPTLCGDGAKTIVKALEQVYQENPSLQNQKPAVAFISSTGITRGPEDVPLSIRPLYHGVLAVPHEDKKEMENVFRDESHGVFKAATGIRPTLLTGSVQASDAIGLEKIKAGTEAKPAIGYSIKRADVGWWIFENVVKEGPKQQQWQGQMCSLTS